MELGLTLSIDEYHGDTSRISKSGLDLIDKSPAHYYYRYLDPNRKPEAQKEWMITGNATGTAITQPDEFKSIYTVLDDLEICREIGGKRPRTTNKYEEWLKTEMESLKGKIILEHDLYNECLAMRDSVYKHKACRVLLGRGQAERTFYFTDPMTGVKCRIRPDWINDFRGYLVDVKTTEDASPDGFGRSAFRYRYDVQDSFYTDGAIANGFTPKAFFLICVEKSPPHVPAVYVIPPEIEKMGRMKYKENLMTYSECQKSGIWRGYEDTLILPLQFPGYAFTKFNQIN